MSELISGKEALIALVNGAVVEDCVTPRPNKDEQHWFDAKTLSVNEIEAMETGGDYDGENIFAIAFRLKPQTIKINGIEVPKPFKPKEGEWFYYVTSETDNYGGWCGTSFKNVNSDDFKNVTRLGAWRTKEEIEQVVKALRSVFNG